MSVTAVVLGVTGVEKYREVEGSAAGCLGLFKRWMEEVHIKQISVIDHMKYVCECWDTTTQGFVSNPPRYQSRQWNLAWDEMVEDIQNSSEHDDQDVYVCLHGVLLSSQLGLRTALNIEKVVEMRPDVVISLVDDVYAIWWRLRERAKEELWKGVPTLVQLTHAISTEAMLGDLIASAAGKPHFIVPLWQPCHTLHRLIYCPGNGKRVYASHPISEPRRMANPDSGSGRDPDYSGIEDVTRWLGSLADQERQEGTPLVVFYPLAIDELPLLRTGVVEAGERVFHIDKRWSMREIFGDIPLLADGCSMPDGIIRIPSTEVDRAKGAIEDAVGWRDFRLIAQSRMVAAWCPVYNNGPQPSSGVVAEKTYAKHLQIPVHYYQNPEQDGNGIADVFWQPTPSPYLIPPGDVLVTKYPSEQELLESLHK